ncbi:MAG TPA: 30S ribosomal protein S16 [Catenuloplanes sp.]
MAVKIRLLRMGKIRNPQYRIVIADSRTKRDGRAIEYVGIYQPKEHPSIIEVKSERVQYWLSVGAQPSEAVQRLLEKTGDWQKFKGLPAPPPLLMAPERANRQAAYEAEAKAAAGLAEPTTKPTKKAEKRAETKVEAPVPLNTAAPAAAEAAPAQASAPAEATADTSTPAQAPAQADAAAQAPAQTEEQAGAGAGNQG